MVPHLEMHETTSWDISGITFDAEMFQVRPGRLRA